MVDRNRTDRPREEDLEQQYMQGARGVESRQVDIPRDQQEDYQRRVYEKADSGFFSTVGKIAAVGFDQDPAEGFFIVEVVVEGAFRYAGFAKYFVDAGGGVTLLRQH